MAQRRRLAEDAGGPRGPTPGSQRAALYVHVSGEGRRRLGRGVPEARRRLSRCEPTCRLSPVPDEVWGPFPGREMSWSGDLKSLVLTISLTLTK